MKDYFTSIEFCKTDTGLPNHFALSPSRDAFKNYCQLKTILNVLRHLVGCPIIINSGFRSPQVNAAVGGVENSRHLYGLAADISCRRPASLKDICCQFYKAGIFSEFIVHDTYIHVAL